MKNKFTKRAEDALRYSKTLAEGLGHTFIGTEHILIGLIEEENCVASKLLKSKGAEKEALTDILCRNRGKGELSKLTSEDMTLSAKKALLEASGNLTPERLRSVALLGVDILSIGALTHSVSAFDISMRMA